MPRTDDRNQIDARLDFQVAARSHLFARYSQSDGDITQGSLFGPPGNGHPNVAALGDAQQLPLLLKKNTIYNLPQSRGEFTFTGQFTSQVLGPPARDSRICCSGKRASLD